MAVALSRATTENFWHLPCRERMLYKSMNSRQLRIYAIADIHSPDSFHMCQLSPESYDLVVTLGDIDEGTLDYIAFMTHGIPLLGVLGNHDPRQHVVFESLHARSIAFRGVRLGGCGGGPRYKKDCPNHYTERQVSKFLRKMPAVDLFISHAPPPAPPWKAGGSRQAITFTAGLKPSTNICIRRILDSGCRTSRPSLQLHGRRDKVMGICGGQPLILKFPEG